LQSATSNSKEILMFRSPSFLSLLALVAAGCGSGAGAAIPMSAGTCPAGEHHDERMSYASSPLGAAAAPAPGYGPEPGSACDGEVVAPPAEDAAVVPLEEGRALGSRALGKPGHSKLCKSAVYRAARELTVYRVWSASKQNRIGAWWSFSDPTAHAGSVADPRQDWRERHGICPQAGDFDRLVVCTIAKDTVFAVGPAQSADCGRDPAGQPVIYEASKTNSVYLDVPHGSDGTAIPFVSCRDVELGW
jgi:hypothetical protein